MKTMLFSLAATAEEGALSFGDRASQAGIVTLQGMLTIFLVLIILWGAIELMHSALHRKKKKKKIKTFIEPSAAENPSKPSEEQAFGTPEDDGAVIAAIVAAIRAMRGEEGNTGAFRVVSFKRVDSARRRKM
ncbi:MAG: OadG family protein [Clostridia bacterium]|jgi:sodium pump decarboxylase gamma subunit|nr:OadG family protein [Clostridia bacterium]MBQ1962621.1 OadG family protein [Clostridia bacterium]MBQ5833225.1 OadG family protein [Clostridia bacterium]